MIPICESHSSEVPHQTSPEELAGIIERLPPGDYFLSLVPIGHLLEPKLECMVVVR